MTVCICHCISDSDLREAVKSGKIQEFLSVKMFNTSCGSCTFDIEKILDQFGVEQNLMMLDEVAPNPEPILK